jgi:hypothetical protein
MKQVAFQILCAITFCAPVFAEQMKSGAWEYKTVTTFQEGPDKPIVKLGEQKMLACLTEEYLKKPPLNGTKASAKGWKCSQAKNQSTKSVEIWSMTCTTPTGQLMEMRSEARKQALDMTQEITTLLTDGSVTSEGKMKGEGTYIGECTPDMMRF